MVETSPAALWNITGSRPGQWFPRRCLILSLATHARMRPASLRYDEG